MILYTNGCSWTWGGGLDNHFITNNILDQEKRLSTVWPHHLGKLLGADKVVNLSSGCGSNSRMIRTTLDWIKTLSRTECENTIAVLQFTEWSRFELYSQIDNNNEYENIQDRWLKCKVDTAILTGAGVDPPDDVDNIIDFVNRKVTYETSIVWVYQTLSWLYALKGIFDNYGIKKYYFWHMGQSWKFWPKEYKDEVCNNFNILDKDEDWIYDRVNTIDTHPNINGHKQIAHIIYNKINET